MVREMEPEDYKNLINAHADELREAVENENTYRAKSEANIIIGILQIWRDKD